MVGKIEGLKRGDKVRVAFDGEVMLDVDDRTGGLTVMVDGVRAVGFPRAAVIQASFSVEKIVPPIAVEDRVEWTEYVPAGLMSSLRTRQGTVVGLFGDYATIQATHQTVPVVVDVRLLRHA